VCEDLFFCHFLGCPKTLFTSLETAGLMQITQHLFGGWVSGSRWDNSGLEEVSYSDMDGFLGFRPETYDSDSKDARQRHWGINFSGAFRRLLGERTFRFLLSHKRLSAWELRRLLNCDWTCYLRNWTYLCLRCCPDMLATHVRNHFAPAVRVAVLLT
jgi:hypothetical protein